MQYPLLQREQFLLKLVPCFKQDEIILKEIRNINAIFDNSFETRIIIIITVRKSTYFLY